MPTDHQDKLQELFEEANDLIEDVPELTCFKCGGTNCDSEHHPELDGSPTEYWCNTCDSSQIFELRKALFLKIEHIELRVSKLLTQAHQDTEQRKEIAKWREEMRDHLESYGKVADMSWTRGMLCALDIMQTISNEPEQLAPSEQRSEEHGR